MAQYVRDMVTFEQVCEIALSLLAAEEVPQHDMASRRVRGRIFAAKVAEAAVSEFEIASGR
jgi:hypothetical protein